MRLILNLAFALALVSGTAMLTGCNKDTAKHTTETKDRQTMPGGGEKETKTTTESKETPPNNK